VNRTLAIFIAATLCFVAPCLGEPPDFTKGPEAWLTPTADEVRPSLLQFRVEMRRAGGPRPWMLEEIFRDPSWQGSEIWSYELYNTCRRRLVDCNMFLGSVSDRAKDAVRRQARLQALGTSERRELYRDALKRRTHSQDPSELQAADAAEYALTEGMDDLLPDIKRWLNSRSSRDTIPYLTGPVAVHDALHSPDPTAGMLNILERAVRDEVDDLVHNDPGHKRPEGVADEIIGARVAFDGLRKLNPPDVLPTLKALYKSYARVDESYERRAKELDAKQQAGERINLSLRARLRDHCRFGGALRLDLAQLIGDLGDRPFERRIAYEEWKTCGGGLHEAAWPIPWDRLEVIERNLVKKGTMTESEMVTR
jgi:hypothetical protein